MRIQNMIRADLREEKAGQQHAAASEEQCLNGDLGL
jgi:hypothetical protein